MKPDEFERKMRLGERFHHLRVEEDCFLVLRVDGRSFSRFTERKVEKPFDARFHDWMRATTEALFVGFDGIYAFTESDEISVLLPQQTQLFDREVEKLVSLSASKAAATFSLACGEAVDFDARIWVGESVDNVLDYFRWRQDDATRCALNGWSYWTLRKQGATVAAATARLEGLTRAEKEALLAAYGISFAETPLWQQTGSGLYWNSYVKEGFDPVKQVATSALRRRLAWEEALPSGDAYRDFLRAFL
jgi:tRNA(His) 5'-end guanylyltransferase